MAKRTRSLTNINNELRLNILNPSESSGSGSTEGESAHPSSLQEHCRTMILHSVGLKNLARITELPLPKAIINSLSNQLTLEDFYVNKNELSDEHMSHCVYPAKCLLDMSDMVLKVVPETLASDEINAAVERWAGTKHLSHPNLMSYYITFTQDSTKILIFEYPPYAFVDIIKHLKQKKKNIPEFLLWKAFHDLAAVMKYLHDQGVSYPGLKPDRLSFTEDGVLKLDSGILYYSTQQDLISTEATGISDEGITGVYTSPETLKGEELTIKNDIWLLGCFFYEMAALEPAYANVGTDMFSAMGNIMEGKKPKALEGYSDDLNATISECLNTEPQTRPTIEDLQARSNAKMEALVESYKGVNITHL